MGTQTPRQRIIMRSLPCLSRTPGSATPIIRSLPKEVFLYEWWLVRATTESDRNHLHVAGFTSRGRQVMEIFHPAAIVKRHGTATLESVDGITISLSGLINRFRTLENGFSEEVCEKFLLGFPYNWEEFATDRVSPSKANPQLSGARSSSKYTLPVAFEDLPAVAIQDLLMSIPGDSKSSMMRIVVENIRKSYAGSSCSGGNMTDYLKEDASHGMKDSFTKENQTRNIENAVEHVHTVIRVAPETTSNVVVGVEILQNPENITKAGADIREKMNSTSENPLDSSCVDSHASVTSAGAGVRESINSASEKGLEGSWFDSHASNTNSTTMSGKKGHLGSLVEDSNPNKREITESEENSKGLSVDYVVPQSCNKINVEQKKRGTCPVEDMSTMRVTRSMKRQKKISFQDISAMPDAVTPAIVLEMPENNSHVLLSRCQVSSTGTLSEPPKKKLSFEDISAMPDGVTQATVLEMPEKNPHVPTTSELSKPQNEAEKVEESPKRSTLRRSTRLQKSKQHVIISMEVDFS